MDLDFNNDEIEERVPKCVSGWSSILQGIWKQHFTSGLQRGDVVILHHPSKEGSLCKRIIGLPGDIILRTDGGSEESNHRVTVPQGHLWVEGDNSLQSHDSRAYGPVPASLIVGQVICRLWPLREYVSLGLDANGVEHWRRVGARIGRRGRRLHIRKRDELGGLGGKDNFNGSYVLDEKREREREKYQ